MPKLDGILETAIYTEDMVRSRAFYEGVLGLLMRWPGTMCCWSFARAPRARPSPCPAGPFPVMAAMARCMWRSPSARTNSIVGRRISLRAGLSSKGGTTGLAAAAAYISATQTGTFWNSQRRDCGRCIRRYKLFPVSDTRPSFRLPFTGSSLCLGDLHISQSSRLVYVEHFDMAMWKPLLQFHARF